MWCLQAPQLATTSPLFPLFSCSHPCHLLCLTFSPLTLDVVVDINTLFTCHFAIQETNSRCTARRPPCRPSLPLLVRLVTLIQRCSFPLCNSEQQQHNTQQVVQGVGSSGGSGGGSAACAGDLRCEQLRWIETVNCELGDCQRRAPLMRRNFACLGFILNILRARTH